MAIHIPKGEGIKIIKQYSEATTNDSIYILPIDGKYAEMIIVDKVGGKRKVGFSLPENLALHDIVNSDGEITTKGNTYLKTQIDALLNSEKTTREGKDAELEMKIQSETRARESKDNELKTAIETEQQERIAKNAEINETISTINNELNSEKTTREQADISLDGKIGNLKSIVESLSDWKNLMVNEDADAIINTITEIVSAFRNLPEGSNVLELLNAKVNISSIVNNLESEIENVPLSAKQGKILKDLINDTKTLLEQSNTTQDTAIAGKLDKTTTPITEPNAEFKYVYLTNEANETRRMLAGDLGKNVANSKPTSVAGAGLNMRAIWDIDTNGFPLRMKGLPDKSADTTFNNMRVQDANGQESVSSGKAVMESLMASLPSVKNSQTGNYDLNFSEYLVFNPTTGKFAKSDRPQIVSNFNVPQNLNITLNPNIQNVQFTPKPQYSQNIIEALEFLKGVEVLEYARLTFDEFLIYHIQDEDLPDAVRNNETRKSRLQNMFTSNGDGSIMYRGVFGSAYNEINTEYRSKMAALDKKSLCTVFFNKELPVDRDWVMGFKTNFHSGERLPSFSLAFSPSVIDRNDYLSETYLDISIIERYYNDGYFLVRRSGNTILKNRAMYNTAVWLIKRGDVFIILCRSLQNGAYYADVGSYNEEFKYLYLYLTGGLDGVPFSIQDIRYWISE